MPTPACKQEGCEYPDGGHCMEGISPPDSCPHAFLIPDATGEDEEVVHASEPEATDLPDKADEEIPREPDVGITLPSGRALSLDEAHVVCQAHETRIVVLLGDRDSGKTTLLAELFQKFLRGHYGGFLFAQSRTLLAFERRCYLARIRSGRSYADTERTKSGSVRLLHLSVRRRGSTAVATHLLLVDMSGEFSRQIRSSFDEVRELLPLMRRADRVVFLVDGDRLTSPETRQLTVANSKMRFKALLEVGALDQTTPVDHIVSKWDCVADAEGGEEIAARLERETTADFGSAVGSLALHRVASRVEREVEIEPGLGIAGLLEGWTTARVRTIDYQPRPPSAAARAFVRYRFEELAERS